MPLKTEVITILLICFSDGMRESNVVTKVFEVEYVSPPDFPPEDDDLEFREEMEKERTMVIKHIGLRIIGLDKQKF